MQCDNVVSFNFTLQYVIPCKVYALCSCMTAKQIILFNLLTNLGFPYHNVCIFKNKKCENMNKFHNNKQKNEKKKFEISNSVVRVKL